MQYRRIQLLQLWLQHIGRVLCCIARVWLACSLWVSCVYSTDGLVCSVQVPPRGLFCSVPRCLPHPPVADIDLRYSYPSCPPAQILSSCSIIERCGCVRFSFRIGTAFFGVCGVCLVCGFCGVCGVCGIVLLFCCLLLFWIWLRDMRGIRCIWRMRDVRDVRGIRS